MKFTVKGPFQENIYNLMRKAGYSFQGKDEDRSQLSFVKPRRGYPRFHIYLKPESDLVFTFHLDQKKTIYKGTTAHSGEYDGKIIEEEANRIKQCL